MDSQLIRAALASAGLIFLLFLIAVAGPGRQPAREAAAPPALPTDPHPEKGVRQ